MHGCSCWFSIEHTWPFTCCPTPEALTHARRTRACAHTCAHSHTTPLFPQARDEDGNRRLTGGDEFQAHLRGPASLVASVKDNGDGTYLVTYSARVAGVYRLDITTSGGEEHVADSPYPLRVRRAGERARWLGGGRHVWACIILWGACFHGAGHRRGIPVPCPRTRPSILLLKHVQSQGMSPGGAPCVRLNVPLLFIRRRYCLAVRQCGNAGLKVRAAGAQGWWDRSAGLRWWSLMSLATGGEGRGGRGGGRRGKGGAKNREADNLWHL
jgi:hypothetical protein